MSELRYFQLMNNGKELLKNKDYHGAEEVFHEALECNVRANRYDDSALNNLAAVIYYQGEPTRSLNILEPMLADSSFTGSPFTYSLAAKLLAVVGRHNEARTRLKESIALFEDNLALLDELDIDKIAWYQYTVQIMRGAGALSDHRLVIDLYRRWEKYHVSWENQFLAGIAAFNLKRFKQAASFFNIKTKGGALAKPMQEAAQLMETETIPPFSLEYEIPDAEEYSRRIKNAQSDDSWKAELAGQGNFRLLLLTELFGEDLDIEHAKCNLSLFIVHGGDWGRELGLYLLESKSIPRELKKTAAALLVEQGTFKENEPIKLLIDGKEETFMITKFSIDFDPDPELDKLDEQAQNLKEQGKHDKAIALLESLYEKGTYYFYTLITLANLYRETQKLDQARDILEMLSSALPGEPVIQINLAGLYLQKGEYQLCLESLDGINKNQMKEEFKTVTDSIRSSAEKKLANC